MSDDHSIEFESLIDSLIANLLREGIPPGPRTIARTLAGILHADDVMERDIEVLVHQRVMRALSLVERSEPLRS